MAVLLWKLSDVAKHRGVTRGAVYQYVKFHPLPEPRFVDSQGNGFWFQDDLVEWSDGVPRQNRKK